MEPQCDDVGRTFFHKFGLVYARAVHGGPQDLTSIAVDLDQRLPRVCLKCAATDEIVRRPEVLNVVSQSARNMGMVGGVLGAVVASTMRNDKDLLIPLLVVLGVGLAIFSFFANKNARKVDIAIPLCPKCDERWSKAKAARPFFLAAFAGTTLGLVLGMVTESKPLLVGAGVLFVAAMIYAVVTKPAAAFVGATWAEGSKVVLSMVNERTVAMIRNGEVPKRKKKQKVASEPDE